MTEIKDYDKEYQDELTAFLEKCLPESGRCFDIDGRHSYYKDIKEQFRFFRCLFDGERIVGTVAVAELDSKNCELKSLYLLRQGLGKTDA